MIVVYAQGPPVGRPQQEFENKKKRGLTKIIQGQEYARMATDTRDKSRANKAMGNIKQILEWEGWNHVLVLEEA